MFQEVSFFWAYDVLIFCVCFHLQGCRVVKVRRRPEKKTTKVETICKNHASGAWETDSVRVHRTIG